jgi:hypothetical protein
MDSDSESTVISGEPVHTVSSESTSDIGVASQVESEILRTAVDKFPPTDI